MTAYTNCPKCGSTDILKFNNRSGPKGPNFLYVCIPSYLKIGVLPLGWKTVTIPTHICLNCGYIQNYIDNLEDLELIKSTWGKEI